MENESVQILLARLDERMCNVETAVGHINRKLDEKYVTHAEFEPVKKCVYGLVSIILVAVVGAIVALVVTH